MDSAIHPSYNRPQVVTVNCETYKTTRWIHLILLFSCLLAGCIVADDYSWFALDVMAALLEELTQNNSFTELQDCIWSLFCPNMAAESLSCKSQEIDCKPRIAPFCCAIFSRLKCGERGVALIKTLTNFISSLHN